MNILVSACLLGVNCRYDGKSSQNSELFEKLKEHNIIPICPEQLGGLATPRPPAENLGDDVITKDGREVTEEFSAGAMEALKITRLSGATSAILKARSPSCGSGKIYDGSFSGVLIDGDGLTAKLLKANGIEVYNEENYHNLLK